jgi:hypothetical protein
MVTDSNGEVLRRTGAAALVVLWACGLTAADAPEKSRPPSGEEPASGAEPAAPKDKAESPKVRSEKKKPGADLPWVTLEKGLVAVREKYSAAVIVHDARRAALGAEEAGAEEEPGFLDGHLTDVSLRDALKKFILIRIEPGDLEKPYPPISRDPAKKAKKPGGKEEAPDAGEKASPPGSTARKLELEPDVPCLLLLSFREEVVRRYDRELPVPSRLKRDLANVWKVNEVHAREAKRVEPQIETSRYAYRLGKVREAVQKMLPFEEKDSRRLMDAVLDKQVKSLLDEYRARAKEALAEADDLDADSKYEAAIKAFDKAAQDFPFTDVIRTANKRKSEILRKLTLR